MRRTATRTITAVSYILVSYINFADAEPRFINRPAPDVFVAASSSAFPSLLDSKPFRYCNVAYPNSNDGVENSNGACLKCIGANRIRVGGVWALQPKV